VQVLVLPVSDRHAGYATGMVEELRVAGLRADVDDRSESVGKRIRDGQLQKVPYLLVVGDREQDAKAVSVRARGDEKGDVSLEEFVREVTAEVAERRLPITVG
jgi:threonyl-tRNA synthetase